MYALALLTPESLAHGAGELAGCVGREEVSGPEEQLEQSALRHSRRSRKQRKLQSGAPPAGVDAPAVSPFTMFYRLPHCHRLHQQDSAVQDIYEEAPSLCLWQDALPEVLAAAARILGAEVAPGQPLMEAGLDSLGVTSASGLCPACAPGVIWRPAAVNPTADIKLCHPCCSDRQDSIASAVCRIHWRTVPGLP